MFPRVVRKEVQFSNVVTRAISGARHPQGSCADCFFFDSASGRHARHAGQSPFRASKNTQFVHTNLRSPDVATSSRLGPGPVTPRSTQSTKGSRPSLVWRPQSPQRRSSVAFFRPLCRATPDKKNLFLRVQSLENFLKKHPTSCKHTAPRQMAHEDVTTSGHIFACP